MPLLPRRRPKPDPDNNTPLGPDEGTDRKDGWLDRWLVRKKERTKGRTARAGVLKWFFFSVVAVIVLVLVVKFFIL
jgi:hypothetical protein|tara:strand:+ start:119 stop:346 length:228 start_codon:yes stop_codon:yes gene_type:complete